MHLLVYTRQVSWRLNDKSFSWVGVLYNLKMMVILQLQLYYPTHQVALCVWRSLFSWPTQVFLDGPGFSHRRAYSHSSTGLCHLDMSTQTLKYGFTIIIYSPGFSHRRPYSHSSTGLCHLDMSTQTLKYGFTIIIYSGFSRRRAYSHSSTGLCHLDMSTQTLKYGFTIIIYSGFSRRRAYSHSSTGLCHLDMSTQTLKYGFIKFLLIDTNIIIIMVSNATFMDVKQCKSLLFSFWWNFKIW